MVLTDIKYIKSLNPLEFLDKPSKETLEYLPKLLEDQNFVDIIHHIRLYYNFPKTGIDLIPFIGLNFFDLVTEKNEILKDALYLNADNLRIRMNLHPSFTQQLYLLMYYNSIIDMDYYDGFIADTVDFAVTKKQIISKLMDYKHEVATVFIPYNMSFNAFNKAIKEIWNKLQDDMSSNLSDNPYEIRLHKNTELALEITRLRENDNKTFAEISQELYSKYGEKDERLSDEKYVKKLYYDYKMLWLKPQDIKVPKS